MAAPLAVDAQRPEKLYRIGMLERTSTAINAANLEASDKVCGSLGTSRGRASSSSIDRPMAATNGSPAWPLSWFG